MVRREKSRTERPSEIRVRKATDDWDRVVSLWREAGLGERPPKWLEEFPTEAGRLASEALACGRVPVGEGGGGRRR